MGTTSAEEERDLQGELAKTRAKLEELRDRLKEPEEIMRAIRDGEVDAFVVTDPRGEKIYSLRNSDLLFRRMVEEMKEGAVALDDSGIIVYANQCFASLMKTTRDDLLGASVFRFVPDEWRSFFDVLGHEGGVEVGRSELVLRTSDGQPVPVQATMNRIDLEGSVFCLIVTDLTSERRREQLLAESRQKDEFLAMLAHELRNPIAPIRNAVNLIGLSAASEPRVQWAKEVIERQVVQLSRLVDDLLDISRITRGKIRLDMQPLSLATAVARGIETAQPAIEARGHTLSVDLPSGPLEAMGDATRLSQVVSNILHNAAKFTPKNGQISLRVEHGDGEARIAVRDNGVGIRKEMLSKIFDLFTQVDSSLERAQGGLGIGLALVRNLVELHHGRVEVYSDGPGQGSEFVVVLPILPSPSASAENTEVAPAAVEPIVQTDRRRVLVVDDNLDSAESTALLLQHLGHDVQIVSEGRKVVRAAEEFRPQIVILDISLPDVNGFDVAAELRANPALGGLCLVALTGYGQEDDRRRSREAGFDHHWVKPLDFNVLKRFLASLSGETPDRATRS